MTSSQARIDPITDGRPDPRPQVRENLPILGDLRNDFDFNQVPRRPFILSPHPLLLRYSGHWHGRPITLLQSPAIILNRLPDARAVGKLARFHTNDPVYRCLNGTTLTVSTAPNELPHTHIVTTPPARPPCPSATWTIAGNQ